jgi:hypothetical protein
MAQSQGEVQSRLYGADGEVWWGLSHGVGLHFVVGCGTVGRDRGHAQPRPLYQPHGRTSAPLLEGGGRAVPWRHLPRRQCDLPRRWASNSMATSARHPPPTLASAEPGPESHRAPLGSFGQTGEEEDTSTHLVCCDGRGFARRVAKNPALRGAQPDLEHAKTYCGSVESLGFAHSLLASLRFNLYG